VSRNGNLWNCWTSVDDVIEVVGLFSMLCRQEYGECDNVDCCGSISGRFCTINDPIARKPVLVGNGTSLQNFEVSVLSPNMNRIVEDCRRIYYCFVDQRKGDLCRNILPTCPDCNGMRCNSKITSSLPPILQIKLNFEDTNSRLSEIQPTVTVMGENYLISVMILFDGGHFQSITLVGGKYLHYDAMKRPPLQWLDHHTRISSINGYHVSEMWYIKKKWSGEEMPQEQFENSETKSTKFKKTILQSENNSSTSKKAVSKWSLEKNNRRKYPIGLSLWPVSSRGIEPCCSWCRGKLERNEHHAVVSSMNDKKWLIQDHYHMKCCKNAFDQSRLKQLISQLNVYEEIPQDEMYDLIEYLTKEKVLNEIDYNLMQHSLF